MTAPSGGSTWLTISSTDMKVFSTISALICTARFGV
jgi:hypothetical protein